MTGLFHLKVSLRRILGEKLWAAVRRLSPLPRHRLIRITQKETNCVVQAGPFRGMRYSTDTLGGGYIPKLLGIYERELHDLVWAFSTLDIREVINIGAADGYYAVGLARQNPALHVIAFEAEQRGRKLIEQMALDNSVSSQIKIKGHCDVANLSAVLQRPEESLVFCDVEGFEDVLLNPEVVPVLQRTRMLVELHDRKNAGVSQRIKKRFASTHEISAIWQEKRTAEDFPIRTGYTAQLDPIHLSAAVDEGRPLQEGSAMSWFWMVPKRITA
jgi:hypothetical protein